MGLAEAPWINATRVVMYSRLIAALYLVVIVGVLALSPGFVDPLGKPVGNDFVGFWAAGRMALEGHPTDAYDYNLHEAEEQRALPWKANQKAPFLPWTYPPTFLIVMAALAMAPYGVALGLWLAATLAVYLRAIRGIMPGWNAAILALAFPAVFSNLAHGQTGFLTTGLLGGALLLLDQRPWVAGVLFGLLAYKPQFGLLVPLALLAGGYWRAICAAGLTVVGTVAASWTVWGGEPWRAFLSAMQLMSARGLETGSIDLEKLQSAFAAMRMFGGSVELAWAIQIAFAMVSAGVIVWAWRRPGSIALRGALLATTTLMATPYIFDYDLTLLALPIAWMASLGVRNGFLPWEKTVLLTAWLLPLLSRTIGKYAHLPAAPLVTVLLLTMVLKRFSSDCPRPLEPSPPLRQA